MSDIALAVSRIVEQYLLVLWLAVLLAVVGWSFRGAPRGVQPSAPVRARLRMADVAALASLVILTVCYAVVLLYRAELAQHDQSILNTAILRGEDISLAIWPDTGRFFPLGHQEFNLLRRFAGSINGYLLFAVAELALLCVGILVLMRSFSIPLRVLIIALVMVTPSVVEVFQGLIYPERNLLLLLVVIALGIRREDDRPSRWALAATLVATHVALYLKEPVFLLLGGVAGTRLLIDWLSVQQGRRATIRELLVSHRLESGMLALIVVFLLCYAATMLPYRSAGYAENAVNSGAPMEALIWYLRAYPLLTVFLASMVIRAVALARGVATLDRLWDPLAIGTLLYFVAYVLLGLRSGYYLGPVDLLGILFLAEMARRAVDARRLRAWIPVSLAVLLGLVLGMSSWYLMIREKNALHARVVLADYVRQLALRSASPVRVHVPMQPPYAIMEFGSYLRYKGVPVVTDSAGHADGGGVILEAPHPFPGGRCIPYRDVPCSRADTPTPGAIVLIMADAEPVDSLRSLRPVQPVVTVDPFGIPPILPVLRWVRTRLESWDVTMRTDWLWAYAEVAK